MTISQPLIPDTDMKSVQLVKNVQVTRLFEPINKTQVEPVFLAFVDQNDDPPNVDFLIPGILPGCKLVLVHGPAGAGKTTLSCHLAAIIIEKTDQLVVYLDLEGKSGDVQEKLLHFSKKSRENIVVAKPTAQFSLFDTSHQDALERYLEELTIRRSRPVFIILDSLMAATGGSLTDGRTGGVMVFFNRLAARFGTIWVIHHNNKSKVEESTGQTRIFGSALISGAVVVAFEIDFCGCEFARTLKVSKSNMSALPVDTEIVVGVYPGKPPCAFRMENGKPVDPQMDALVAQCRDILMSQLQDGQPKLAKEFLPFFDGKYDGDVVQKASDQLQLVITHPDSDDMTVQLPKNSIALQLYLGSQNADSHETLT